MRVDLDTCRDPELLAAEVRRLRGVIAAGEPTLTDAEREAVARAARRLSDDPMLPRDRSTADTLRGLLEKYEGGER